MKTHSSTQKKNRIDLTPHAIEEILLFLPVKAVLRFNCVCKSWNACISDPLFIRTRLQRNSHETYIITQLAKDNKMLIIDKMDEEPNTTDWFDIPRWYRDRYCRFHCICDGVLCFTVRETNRQLELVFWNPSIKKYNTLNILKHNGAKDKDVFVLGYDKSINDYKLVRFSNVKDSDVVEVMAMKPKQWRRVQSHLPDRPHYNSKRLVMVSLHGAVYWLSRKEKVVRFDLADETFSIVPSPAELCYDQNLRLLEFQGKLCLTCKSSRYHEIWVLEDETNWFKLFSGFSDIYNQYNEVCFFRGGAFFAGRYGTIYIPNVPEEINRADFNYNTSRWRKPFMCVNSLVLPF